MTMKHGDNRTREELQGEIEQLRYRLDEAEQTLEAIRSGEVDALVVAGPHGDQIFSLTGSERIYRQIIETMNEGALTVTIDGTILFCNQRFCSLLQYPMAEIIGRNCADFAPPSGLPQLKALLDNAQSGPAQQFFHLWAAVGPPVPVNIAASMLVTETENSICLVVSDLTELERQANSIYDLLREKHILEVHQTELNASNEELRDSQRAALNLVEDVEIARRKVEEANKELRREILVRKQAEEELRKRERLFQDVIDGSPSPIFLKDREGRFITINASLEILLGRSREEIQGKTDYDIATKEVADYWRINDQQVMATGKAIQIEEVADLPDGHHVFLANKFPLVDSDGHIYGVGGISHDITDRKQAEELIKKSLAEKEVLLREIHHRVKNNLQVISSLVSLQADTLADESLAAVFGDVRDRVRSMALVHEKLYQTGDLAKVNFGDYAASLLNYLWRSHGALAEKARLNLAVAPVALPIEAAVPCGLILNELAGNALKHAFPDNRSGEVSVGLDQDQVTAEVCLWVRDNGVGLPADTDWRQSRSLGLRLVQMLAGQLRGSVETGTGPGTEFRITFPLKGVSL
ncbi:PAS domain-containing protein [Geobacter pelophilus]|uniref:PAS domain-containing protein n=1 Tax=Geoanaerobacter pelophilus TaxID=60036 RepID=A0AAW4L3G1_9BACT|nr:PAS domain-containing protein [Geoanaerobacter pelophilus]MBT0664040.1 PAS domain-containing protein [Geoanaerobacter pelophilus]